MALAIGLLLAFAGVGLSLWADFEMDLHRPFTAHVLASFSAGCLVAALVAVVIST